MNEKIKSSYKPWQDKEWLTKQYHDNGLSFKKIGKLCGKSGEVVRHFFARHGLKSRPSPFLNPGIYKGKDNPRWIGGRVYDSAGYIKIFHPESHAYKPLNNKYVLEHILIMEKILGRPLKHPEIVHHKNGKPADNRPENLILFPSNKEHKQFEQRTETFAKNLLFGDIAPHLKDEVSSLFNEFLSSVNER